MKKTIALLALFISANSVFAGGTNTPQISYKVEWSDGLRNEVVARPGVPATVSIGTVSKKSECRFKNADGGETTLAISPASGKSVFLVVDAVSKSSVKTFVYLTSSISQGASRERLSAGNCDIQTGKSSAGSITAIEALAWGKRTRYVLPDASTVHITATKL